MSSSVAGQLLATAEALTTALAAGSVTQLLAVGARCTVNGHRIDPTGSGPASAPDGLGLLIGSTLLAQGPVIDVDTGQAGLFAVAHPGRPATDDGPVDGGAADGGPVVVGLRFRGGAGPLLVDELEVLVSPPGRSSVFAPDRLGTGNPIFDAAVDGPAPSRADLVAVAASYFDDIEAGTGHTRFQPGCQRIENGFQTTSIPAVAGGAATAEQFERRFFAYITAVRGRRYPIVDRARGVVWAVAFLDVAGTVTHLQRPDGGRVELPERLRRPRSTLLFERFKVIDGALAWIEAVMVNLPFGAPTGWEQTDPS